MSFRFGSVSYSGMGHGRLKTQNSRPRMSAWGVLCLVSCILCLVTILSWTSPAFAQRGGNLGEDKVKVTERGEDNKAKKLSFFNVVNVDIHDILKFMSDETNLTIIASDKVQGKITLVNLKDITVEEALEALKTALNTLGFTTVHVNRTIVIISLEDAKTKSVRVAVGSDPDQIDSTDEMITQIMPLNYADAAEMAQNLKNLIPKSGDMFADATSNSLIITDVSSNIRRLALILKQLDTEPGETLTTRVFQLTYADATSLERTLEDMFRQGVEMARGLQRLSSRGTEEMMKRIKEAQRDGRMPGRGIDFVKGLVVIESDERTNKLIITASPENLASIEKMLLELDTSQVAQSEIKVFELGYGIAADVAQELQDLLQGDSSAGSRRRNQRNRWDRQRDRGRGGDGEGGLKGIQGEVNVVSDDRLNAVVVVTDPQNIPLIENIIKQLDKQVDPQEVIKIIPLEYADATNTVQNLETLFSNEGSDRNLPWWERARRSRDRQEQGEGITGIQGEVSLVADTRLNAIVISTAASNIPIITGLISELDKTIPDLESSTKIIPLFNADAENMADILNNVYQSGGGQQRGWWWMQQRSRQSTRGTAFTGTVTVSAYPRTNSLIVTSSSARNFEMIEALIRDMDQETPADFKYKTLIYQLEYSDATEMEQLLNNMFSEDGGSSSRQNRSFFRMIMSGDTMLKDMTTLAGQVRVNADTQTNTLIFTTPERNFAAIRDLMRQLDIVRGQVWLEIQVYEALLSDDTRLGLEWMWEEGNHLGRDGVTGEFGTDFQLSNAGLGFTYKVFNKNLTTLLHTLMRENKVKVISTTSLPTRDNTAASMSKGKDIPYLESTQTDNFGNILYNYNFLQDIGISIGITPHIAKAGIKASRNLLFGIEMDNQSNLDDGTITEALKEEFKGHKVLLSADVSVSPGPEDGIWFIADGDRTYIVRREKSWRGQGSGEHRLNVYLKEKRTVGLDITTMNVSNFIEYTDFNAPVTADTNITTYVDVVDGETILIGGMMKSEEKNVTHQIPILGSIPFLGRLFKKTEKLMEDTELLILITPHIIDINNREDRIMLGELEREQIRDNERIKWVQPGAKAQPSNKQQ